LAHGVACLLLTDLHSICLSPGSSRDTAT